MLEEGARVEIVRTDVADAPPLKFTVAGEKAHVTPGGGPRFTGQAKLTGLEALLAGVMVIVDVALFPAVIEEKVEFAARLKSGMFTLTFRVVEPLCA